MLLLNVMVQFITLLALVIWRVDCKKRERSHLLPNWIDGVQRAICYEPVVAETSSVFENISERVHFKVFLIVVLMDPPMVSVVPKVNPEY